MSTLEEQKQKFCEKVGYICLSAAGVVFNDDKDFPVEKIRLGSEVYTNKDKMATRIIEYSRNVQKAVEMVRKLKSVDEHGPHIDPFIIKYHPTWMGLREQNGFIQRMPGEIDCLKVPDFRTYEEWFKDTFVSLGVNVEPKQNIKPFAIISDKIFLELYPDSEVKKLTSLDNQNHPDFTAFIKTCYVKNCIDNYRKHIEAGKDPKELDCSFKGIGYTLGDDGFPLITIGHGKKTKKYDFRNPRAEAYFYKRLAERDPNSEYGRTYKKMLQKKY